MVVVPRPPLLTSTALDALQRRLAGLGRVVVAFSGGADSAFLAKVALDTLGPSCVLAVTAVSPSLAAAELDGCAALAAAWGLPWQQVATDEMERAAYRRNDGDRCYHCKSALMDALEPVVAAAEHAAVPGAAVVLGVNVDDLTDHRPGQRAAVERGAVFPLVEAGFTKADVREWSRRLGLPTWDKPAAPCLASRVPYGTPVTVQVLSRVERAEAAVRALGFGDLRVRHHGDRASVEVPSVDVARLERVAGEVRGAVRRAGYAEVDLDPAGLRSGHLNAALPGQGGSSPVEGAVSALEGADDGGGDPAAVERAGVGLHSLVVDPALVELLGVERHVVGDGHEGTVG